jgi:hypothetical protein
LAKGKAHEELWKDARIGGHAPPKEAVTDERFHDLSSVTFRSGRGGIRSSAIDLLIFCATRHRDAKLAAALARRL